MTELLRTRRADARPGHLNCLSRLNCLGRLNRLGRTLGLLLALCLGTARAWADTGIFEGYVVLSFGAAGTQTFYRVHNGGPNIPFNNNNIGTLPLASAGGVMNFDGGQVKTFKNGTCNAGNTGNDVFNGRISYLVYPTGSRPASPTFTPVNLPFDQNLAAAGDQQWTNKTNTANLLAGLAPDNYTLEVFFQSDYGGCNAGTNTLSLNGGPNYTATFAVASLCGAYTINAGAAASPTNYPSFTAAFTALNNFGLSCNTVFNVTGTFAETPPALGSAILNGSTNGPTGFTLTFQRDATATLNPRITASGGAGTDDAAVKVAGTDNVTFDRIDLASGGTALEYGLALRHLTATDGTQRLVYKGGTVTMDKAYASTCVDFGPKDAAGGPLASTSAAGANSANTLIGNTFANARYGVVLAATPTFRGLNNAIGTAVAGQGNAITDFGLANGSAGVEADNQSGLGIAGNTIASTPAATSGNIATLHGINLKAGNAGTVTVDQNSVTVSGGTATSSVYGIRSQSAPALTALVISNNSPVTVTVPNFTGTTNINGIINEGSPTSVSITGNTITGMSVGGNSSTMVGIEGGIGSCTTTTMTISGNTVQNSTKPGTGGSFYLIRYNGVTCNVFGNTLSNCAIAGGSGDLRGISNVGNNANTTAENIYQNTVSGLSQGGGGSVEAIRLNNTASASTRAVYQNVVSGLGTSAASGVCRGILYGPGGSATGSAVFRNKIFGLNAATTSGNAAGIGATSLTTGTVTLANNVVGNLTAPAATANGGVLGFELGTAPAGATFNLFHNTVRLNAASSGAPFATAVVSTGAATLNPRNNVFANTSTASGAGSAAVYAGAGAAPALAATANNNLYFAGAPGGRNFLYFNTTAGTGDQTLAAYKTRVGPTAEANAVTENPAFASTTGADATFLSPDLTQLTQAANGGTAIGGTTDDYNGAARSATAPDLGAYEVAAVPFDVALAALAAPTGSQCPGSAPQPITATVTNLAGLALTTSATAVLTVSATLTRPDATTQALAYTAPAGTVLTASGGTLAATLTPAQTFDQIGTYTFGNLTVRITDGQAPASNFREANNANNTLTPNPTLTVLGTTTWTGAAASGSVTDWFNPGNWSACVPTLALNAVVPAGATNQPVVGGAGAVALNLTIQGSSAVGMSGAASTLTLAGNLVTASAASFAATAGTVSFTAAAAQSIGAGTFANLTLGGAGVKTLAGPIAVNGTLNLSAGLLQTSNSDLVLGGTTGTIVGAGASNFVVQNGTGRLCVQQVGSAGRPSAAFPVGTAVGSYTPATLANAGTPDTYCVLVTTGVARQGTAVTANVVNRTWDVAEAVPGGSVGTLTLQWNPAEEAPGFVRGRSAVAHYEDNAWNGPCFTCYGAAAAGTVAGSFRQSRPGIMAFSPFGVQDDAKPLPVTLTRFAARRAGTLALLDWATASEQGNAGFGVEVSLDGKAFRLLHFVETAPANGAAPRTYAYADRETGKTGPRYYRLAQRDLGGATTYSPVRAVAFDGPGRLAAVPNPFKTDLTLTVTTARPLESAPLTLTDALGRPVRTQPLTLPAGQGQATLDGLGGLPAGVYFLHLPLGGQVQHLKVVKE